jgi:hypothetical protein
VTIQPPQSAASPQITVRPVRTTVIEKVDGAFEVELYSSMEDIRKARAAGLNSGTLVAVDVKGFTIEVFAVHHDKIETVGKFAPLS